MCLRNVTWHLRYQQSSCWLAARRRCITQEIMKETERTFSCWYRHTSLALLIASATLAASDAILEFCPWRLTRASHRINLLRMLSSSWSTKSCVMSPHSGGKERKNDNGQRKPVAVLWPGRARILNVRLYSCVSYCICCCSRLQLLCHVLVLQLVEQQELSCTHVMYHSPAQVFNIIIHSGCLRRTVIDSHFLTGLCVHCTCLKQSQMSTKINDSISYLTKHCLPVICKFSCTFPIESM